MVMKTNKFEPPLNLVWVKLKKNMGLGPGKSGSVGDVVQLPAETVEYCLTKDTVDLCDAPGKRDVPDLGETKVSSKKVTRKKSKK